MNYPSTCSTFLRIRVSKLLSEINFSLRLKFLISADSFAFFFASNMVLTFTVASGPKKRFQSSCFRLSLKEFSLPEFGKPYFNLLRVNILHAWYTTMIPRAGGSVVLRDFPRPSNILLLRLSFCHCYYKAAKVFPMISIVTWDQLATCIVDLRFCWFIYVTNKPPRDLGQPLTTKAPI